MSDLDIPANEAGVVRLFSIDLPPEQAKALVREERAAPHDGADPLAEALGASLLRHEHALVFDVDDLTGLGLVSYLTEGQGIAETALSDDRARLEQVTGPVLLLRSRAFGGVAQSLSPKPPLGFLGAWHEAESEAPRQVLRSHAAEGHLPQGAPAPAGRSRGLTMLLAGLAVLILLGLLVVWLA